VKNDACSEKAKILSIKYYLKRNVRSIYLEVETKLTVRYAETDQMSIVHHSNYVVWFEAGRTDFLRKSEIAYSDIEAKGIFLPLSHMECTFKNPARYEDTIVVKTKIQKMSCVKLEFCYEVYKDHLLEASCFWEHFSCMD
jgi:acyl-CoA thioester hydrolase